MGIFCDVVVAPVKEAKKIAEANGHLERWPSWSGKGLTDINFMVLHAQLTSRPFESVCRELKWVFTDNESVSVSRLPDDLVRSLAALTPAEVREAAKQWSRAEELKGWDAKDLLLVLKALVKLAREANRKPLLLCVGGF